MSEIITEELKEIIAYPGTIKLVTTVSREGFPHSVCKGSLKVNEACQIEFLELLEGSINNANLVYSIWFNKPVAITIITEDFRSFELSGHAACNVTAGTEFERAYVALQDKKGKEADLAGIWKINIDSVREETFKIRQDYQRENIPLLRHVDALLK